MLSRGRAAGDTLFSMLPLVLLFLMAAAPEADIRGLLERQQADWNRGDLEAFLRGYENSPTLAFVGGSGVTRGFQAVRERYRRGYGTREKMGTLSFSALEVTMLGPEHASVMGRFQLERGPAGGGQASGYFTLLVRRTAGGWRIVQDHTSATPVQ